MRWFDCLSRCAAIATTLVLTACAPSAREAASTAPAGPRRTITLRFHGDTRFGEAERRSVERACLAWTKLTAGRAKLEIVWDYGENNYVELAAAAAPQIKRAAWWHAPPNVGGKVDAIGGGVIRLVPENCPSLYSCTLHELGHALGLAHVASAGSVMSATQPAGQPPVSFTAADRAECARANLCD